MSQLDLRSLIIGSSRCSSQSAFAALRVGALRAAMSEQPSPSSLRNSIRISLMWSEHGHCLVIDGLSRQAIKFLIDCLASSPMRKTGMDGGDHLIMERSMGPRHWTVTRPIEGEWSSRATPGKPLGSRYSRTQWREWPSGLGPYGPGAICLLYRFHLFS